MAESGADSRLFLAKEDFSDFLGSNLAEHETSRKSAFLSQIKKKKKSRSSTLIAGQPPSRKSEPFSSWYALMAAKFS